MSGVIVEVESSELPSSRSMEAQPLSHSSSRTFSTRRRPSASSSSMLVASSISSSQLSSPGRATLSSLPNRRYRRSPRPAFSFLAVAASEFIRLKAAIEVRKGRGGDIRGACGEGDSFGISEKSIAKEGITCGSSACDSRGEHGTTGLVSSIGDDVGDKVSRGDGNEYTELASDCRCPRTGDSLLRIGCRSKEKAASSNGSKVFWASSDVFGMTRATFREAPLVVSMMLLSTSWKLLLSSTKASLLNMAASIVSGVSSGIAVACTGKSYAARSFRLNFGGDIVLGETGGESSCRGLFISAVLWELTDDSSGIVAKSECQAREDVFVGV